MFSGKNADALVGLHLSQRCLNLKRTSNFVIEISNWNRGSCNIYAEYSTHTHDSIKSDSIREGGPGDVECIPRHNDYMGLGETERFGVEIAREYGQAWSLAWPTQLIKPVGM